MRPNDDSLPLVHHAFTRPSVVPVPAGAERHPVNKFRSIASIKLTVEKRRKCNIAAECEELKTVK